MTTRIFKLKQQALPADVEQAARLAEFIEAQGFGAEHLEDLMFQLAEQICLKMAQEVGASTAQRHANQEFTAAQEISQHSIADQLIVLRQSSGSDTALKAMLVSALRIDLPESLWIPSLAQDPSQATQAG